MDVIKRLAIALGAVAVWLLLWLFRQATGDLETRIYEFIKGLPVIGPAFAVVIAWSAANLLGVTFFGLCIWAAYWFGGYERSAKPKFVLEKVLHRKGAGLDEYFLQVRNLGQHSADHIVKLMSVRCASDGEMAFSGMPVPLRTYARKDGRGHSRFNLGNNEYKQVVFCRCFMNAGNLLITMLGEDDQSFTLTKRDPEGYVVTVGLHGVTGTEYQIRMIEQESALTLSILSKKDWRLLNKRWQVDDPLQSAAISSSDHE